MKIMIWVLGVLLLAAAAAAGYFVVTFDADRYRALLITQIEAAVGHPVRLDRVSLTWNRGIGLRIENFGIYSFKGAPEPAFSVAEATADLNWKALLSQRVKIGSVDFFRPEVRLTRLADGSIRLTGAPPPVPEDRTVSAPAAMASLLIGRVGIQDGQLRLTDETLVPPLDITVQKLNLTARDIAVTRPIRFSGSMALWQASENVRFRGKILLPLLRSVTELSDVEMEADLGAIDYAPLMRSCPHVKNIGVNSQLRGNLSVEIEQLRLQKNHPESIKGKAVWREGRVLFPEFGMIENAQIHIRADDEAVQLLPSSVLFADGKIKLEGMIRSFRDNPFSELEAEISGLALEKLPVRVRDGGPRLAGEFSAEIKLRAEGKTWPEIKPTLAGGGRAEVRNGVIQNYNFLREIFGRLSIIPGLVERLMQRLPPDYQQRLAERDTRLRDIDQPFSVADGVVRIMPMAIATEDLALSGNAAVSFDGALDAHAVLAVEPALSAAAIRSVRELQYLTDGQGRIRLPVRMSGTTERMILSPDLQDVASRLAVTKAAEMLGGFLRPTASQPDAPPSDGSVKAPKGSTILAGILETVLQASPDLSRDTQ
jgi:hypothetical protein